MSRPSRRPLYSILVLFCVSCAIYYVATGDNESLGSALRRIPDMQVPLPKMDFQSSGSSKNTGAEKEHVKDSELLEFESERKLSAQDSKVSKAESSLNSESNSESQSESGVSSEQLGGAADGFTEVPFMPKMANETLKAKLGNSAWHLFHTVLARYPDKPSTQEKTTLKSYIHLFAQVYPCGDCARHFQQLLQKYPVQVESRKTAALWGCHVHNKVNERLEKPEYDCTKILEDYDCGCGSDEKEEDDTLGNESSEHLRKVTLDEKGGLQRGG